MGTCKAKLVGGVWLTDIAEHDGQEDESVRRAQQHDAQVHAEVEHLQMLWY